MKKKKIICMLLAIWGLVLFAKYDSVLGEPIRANPPEIEWLRL